MTKRIVILGNGSWKNPRQIQEVIRKTDYIIACDGAYRKSRKIGILPDIVLGDFDSLSDKEIESGVRVLKFEKDKDETDGELALEHALQLKPKEILWLGAVGDRWDHTLANVSLLIKAARKKVPLRICDGDWEFFLVMGSIEIKGRPQELISLIPLSLRVDGVQTRGLKYPLHRESLYQWKTRGVSNQMISSQARIQVKRGWLLVMHRRKGVTIS